MTKYKFVTYLQLDKYRDVRSTIIEIDIRVCLLLLSFLTLVVGDDDIDAAAI